MQAWCEYIRISQQNNLIILTAVLPSTKCLKVAKTVLQRSFLEKAFNLNEGTGLGGVRFSKAGEWFLYWHFIFRACRVLPVMTGYFSCWQEFSRD